MHNEPKRECHRTLVGVFAIAATFCFPSAILGQLSQQPSLRLNQVQVLGTHNSYHSGLTSQEVNLIRRTNHVEADALEYQHQSLAAQLDGGMRELEIDIHADPRGGSFAHPEIQKQLAAAGIADPPFPYPESVMDRPGFKVMHKPNTDFRSNCQPFTNCLQEIAAWSKAHRQHLPLYLFIETKDGAKLTPADCEDLEKEVLSVFSRSDLFIPEDLLGHYETLQQAARGGGWPEVDKVRGKVIFLMSRTDVTSVYETGYPNLKGRLFFTNGPLEDSNTVFTVVSKPDPLRIAALVQSGFLVYTRADADTVEARSNNGSRQSTAFASGAQIITTDYPSFEPARWSGYTVSFPDHTASRCDPINTINPCSVELGQ